MQTNEEKLGAMGLTQFDMESITKYVHQIVTTVLTRRNLPEQLVHDAALYAADEVTKLVTKVLVDA